MTNTIQEKARPMSWHVPRNAARRFNSIEDEAVEEKAFADFGCKMLEHLRQHPEELNIAHLEMLADALGVKPTELLTKDGR